MSRAGWVVLVLPALLLAGSGSQALAQETKTARGTVTAVSGDSLTVKVRTQEMKFNVDEKTHVIAAGAGHKAAAAKTENKGVGVQDLIKTGQAVEVKYHEMSGGAMHAASVRAIATAGEGAMSTDKPAVKHASGKVKSVAADSLTITSSGKDMTFTVDTKTNVVAQGAGTKAAKSGGRLPITDAVKEGDMVSVSYHDMAGTMHAASVHVTQKATK